VRVYGRAAATQEKTLQFCRFYLDPFVPQYSATSPPPRGANASSVGADSSLGGRPAAFYQLSNRAFQLAGNYSSEDDFVQFGDVPAGGTHVLTVMTDPDRPDNITPISAIVVF
jgi:hypothetical protein